VCGAFGPIEAKNPFTDEVLVMCPSSALTSIGRKARVM
jgi:hypothetical protein